MKEAINQEHIIARLIGDSRQNIYKARGMVEILWDACSSGNSLNVEHLNWFMSTMADLLDAADNGLDAAEHAAMEANV